ncbi:MAG: hypothetical protein GY716_02005 [bacterium]|nr:hypothetical protein [bacterium]
MTKKRMLAASLVLLLVSGVALAARQYIVVKDVQLINQSVRCSLTNESSEPRSALVTVYAVVNGQLESSGVVVQIGSGQTLDATVHFTMTVNSIIRVGIIEGPDPIPQVMAPVGP